MRIELPRHSEILPQHHQLSTASTAKPLQASLHFHSSHHFYFKTDSHQTHGLTQRMATFGPSGVVEILLWGALVEVRDFTQKKIENLNACT